MKKRYSIFIMFLYCISLCAQRSNINLKVGEEFPDFEFRTVDGNYVTKDDIIGNVTFLNLWFIHCKPCIDELPELNKLQEQYGNDVLFISATFETSKDVRKFMTQNDFYFEYVATDAGQFFKDKLGNLSYPKNIIIDEDGIVRYIKKGLPSKTVTTLDNKVVQDKADYTYFARYLDELMDY